MYAEKVFQSVSTARHGQSHNKNYQENNPGDYGGCFQYLKMYI